MPITGSRGAEHHRADASHKEPITEVKLWGGKPVRR